jgi:integrase
VRLLKEPARRIRFLNRHQARTLLRELPPHLRDMANFTLATGLRAANVTGLTWEQVDLSRKLAWIHPLFDWSLRRVGTSGRWLRAQVHATQ